LGLFCGYQKHNIFTSIADTMITPSLLPTITPAILVLANGTVFKGRGVGAIGQSTGEVVFNTAMTGYQEILTDPSYAGQMVTLTYPHIGNVGTNAEDCEANSVFATGLIIRDCSSVVSNFRNTQSLPDWLKARNIQAIADIDTRQLTRILRDEGAQNGCILTQAVITEADIAQALATAKAAPNMVGLDLAKVVSTKAAYTWQGSTWALGVGYKVAPPARFKVVAYDFGVKHNILRLLAERGCEITVVPAQTPAAEVLAMQPDGVFLSNGPGDPEPCVYAIDAIKTFLNQNTPLFGICLGHQLLSLASGAKTVKMRTGHHGANHPVKDLDNGRVYITSQNHGFATDAKTLPSNVRGTHVSLFDGTLQGITFTDKPAFGFQGHPEASPGPQEIEVLFDRFIALMQTAQQA
jgi:carbamoyl-phosphate synthase small subunit